MRSTGARGNDLLIAPGPSRPAEREDMQVCFLRRALYFHTRRPEPLHYATTNNTNNMLPRAKDNRWPGRGCYLALGCLLLLGATRCEAQNLVPNPSFEEIDSCPQYPALLGFQPGAIPASWFSSSDTPDYFNACVDTLSSVPVNVFGFQEALDGQAYVGMWSIVPDDHREMISAELLSPLTIGETYYASFYVNAAYGGGQPMDVGCNNIGMLFTMNPYVWVYPMPEFGIGNYAQVRAPDVITDTLGWTLVSGSFVADSAYQFMVIGNHFSNANTDTSYIGPSPWGVYYGWAYAYVDQVCVSPDPSGCPLSVGMIGGGEPIARVFPNPVQGYLHAYFGGHLTAELQVVDVLGRKIWKGKVVGISELTLDASKWANGHYVLQCNTGSGMRSFKFVVVE